MNAESREKSRAVPFRVGRKVDSPELELALIITVSFPTNEKCSLISDEMATVQTSYITASPANRQCVAQVARFATVLVAIKFGHVDAVFVLLQMRLEVVALCKRCFAAGKRARIRLFAAVRACVRLEIEVKTKTLAATGVRTNKRSLA